VSGKILKLNSNDLNGNVIDAKVVVFACFEHTKYMNNYVVFAYEGHYGENKLYYGSVHLKSNSLVIFSVKDNIKKYIDEFLEEYVSNKLINFKLLNIEDMEKVEIVSSNEMDCNNLELLDKKSIYREVEQIVKKEYDIMAIVLYSLIGMLLLFAIALTIIYVNRNKILGERKELICVNKLYDQELELDYDIEKKIIFYGNKLRNIEVKEDYIFLDSELYYDFRDNNKHEQYFNNGAAYKYIDTSLKLRLMYEEDIVIDDYNQMYDYMKNGGFSCIEK